MTIREALSELAPWLPDDLNGLEEISKTVTVPRSTVIYPTDKRVTHVALLMEGVVRSSYITAQGTENTYCFAFAGDCIAPYSAVLTGRTSMEMLTSIGTCTLKFLPLDELLRRGETSLSWMRFFRIMAERQYCELERHIMMLQKESAVERYQELCDRRPEAILTIPQKYLASYLGITPRHLSRIRARKK